MSDKSDELLANWENGKKRRSRYSNEVFLTKKDRRLHDRKFLSERERIRFPSPARRGIGAKMRRTKSIRESNTVGHN